jgi:hypothetical protein
MEMTPQASSIYYAFLSIYIACVCIYGNGDLNIKVKGPYKIGVVKFRSTDINAEVSDSRGEPRDTQTLMFYPIDVKEYREARKKNLSTRFNTFIFEGGSEEAVNSIRFAYKGKKRGCCKTSPGWLYRPLMHNEANIIENSTPTGDFVHMDS